MKNIFSYICYILIIIIGLFNICYGIRYEIKQYSFLKKSDTTEARIYKEVKQPNKKDILYVNYYIKGYKYNGLILSDNKDSNSIIKIYYNKNNPSIITDGTIRKEGYILISFGFLFVVLGLNLLFKLIKLNKMKLNS